MDKKKESAKDLLKKTVKENIYSRKMVRQYEFLKQWDEGKISGIECITAIEDEMKMMRIDDDLKDPTLRTT